MDAAARAGVQRLHRVRGHVDCPVEGHRQRRREPDEPAQPHLVHAAVGKQQPDHDAVRAGRLERLQVRLDHVELCCAVQEVAAPRAEHDVHGQRDGAATAEQLAHAGRRATLEQTVAQLNPGRTALFCGHRGGDTVGTHLQPGRSGGAGAQPVAVAPPGEDRGAYSHGCSACD